MTTVNTCGERRRQQAFSWLPAKRLFSTIMPDHNQIRQKWTTGQPLEIPKKIQHATWRSRPFHSRSRDATAPKPPHPGHGPQVFSQIPQKMMAV
jgi:hypothetical protein